MGAFDALPGWLRENVGPMPAFLEAAAKAPGLLRLKDINMHCGCHYTAFRRFQGLPGYSRYLHSLGVAAICWHFTADLAAALAGLCHDMATPVFSHVVDFLYGDAMTQERTQEGTLERIGEDPVLGGILASLGLEASALYPTEQHPIADNPSPQLAADRLESTLHNGVDYGLCSEALAAQLFADLAVGENEAGAPEIGFQNLAAAREFGRISLACSAIYVAPEDRYAMEVLSCLLRRALHDGVLDVSDLHSGESAVIEKLQASHLGQLWAAFRGMDALVLKQMPGPEPMWRQIRAKKRRIDPLILGHGRLSELDADYRAALAAFRNESQEMWMYCPGLGELAFL